MHAGKVLTDQGADIWLAEQWLDPVVCAHLVQVAECCEFRSPPPGSSLAGELRSNDVLVLDNHTALLESTNALLATALNHLRQQVAKHYDTTFSHLELYAIERFRPGQAHKRHMDGLVLTNRYEELAQGVPARDVTAIAFLNDEFEGGDLLLPRQKVKVKPQTGGVVVFPARYTHPYQALPVLRGCKYTVTSWLFH